MKPARILLFIAAVMVALWTVGEVIPEEGIAFWGHQVHFSSLGDLAARAENHAAKVEEVSEEALEETTPLPSTAEDSVAMLRRQAVRTTAAELRRLSSNTDSAAFGLLPIGHDPDVRFWLPSEHYFDAFFRRAEQAQSQGTTLRILHYGDSQIEMDHLSSRLRAYMQHTFGGGGPGMLPFSTITPSLTIRQSTEGTLTHLSSFGDSTVVKSRGDYGPMMQSFRMASGKATVSLRAAQHHTVDSLAKQFSQLALIYNNHGSDLSATLTDRAHRSSQPQQQKTSESGIGSLFFSLDSASTHLQLTVSGQADLYALLLDNGGGLAVDNIPMRGCSGQQFTLVPQEKLRDAYAQMDIGLIIMQFGGNSMPYFKTTKQISTYCQSIGKQIDHIRHCAPRAKVLFIGPSDMSTRIGGQLHTYPLLPALVDSLATTALTHGAAFWSIYHAMGGEDSMVEWVRQGMAGQDYIHFSQRGADLMGNRLSEAFSRLYALFCTERRAIHRRIGM